MTPSTRGGRRRVFGCLLVAVCTACAGRGASPATPATRARAIDRLEIFVRNWPDDIVALSLNRQGDTGTLTLVRPAYDRQPRVLVDSVRFTVDPERLVAMLDSFDIWALNAPNAPGAACVTEQGQRECIITTHDYSIVMLVQRGRTTRVQRYTSLDRARTKHAARGLGDYILAWARQREEERAQ